MRNAIILPHNHRIVLLLLKHLHEKRAHCGYKSLTYESRKKFWIIGVQSIAKQLTRNCIVCRKLRQRPLQQLMGQLPNTRAEIEKPAFACTAIDMFGPIQIRLSRKTLKEAQIIIFACMTSRAIHLELVTDRTTDAFLMAFRRFACTRGHPAVCWSDHGTNFVAAQDYLREICKLENITRIQNTVAEEFNCQLRWEWNIPTPSPINAVVESLIKSDRQAMDATSRRQSLTEEQWRTCLAEVTHTINSRPLYPNSDAIWENPPITPNDLIIGPHAAIPVPNPEERVNPRHLARATQQRVQGFWESWLKYFAPTLLPRNKWYRPRTNLQPGDLVLELEAMPRRKWKMALVQDCVRGNRRAS
ncbi:uncharacterized protein [Montipora capricornis]|uniref:uncharacterized protein n=1 Tax=Montipora capricornis TaxID=246305 RepID=UPI0035F14A7B